MEPHTRWFVAAYYALAIVWGLRSVWQSVASALDFLVPFALAITLAAWAITDADHRGRPIPWLVQPWFVLFAVLSVPVYTVWSRRWRGLMWVIVHGVGWFVIATATTMAAGLLIFGEPWRRALPW